MTSQIRANSSVVGSDHLPANANPVCVGLGVGDTSPPSANRLHDGDIAEVLVFDRGLSQIEIDAVEQILMEKWGL